MSVESKQCPKCGKSLPATASGGRCYACLWELAANGSDDDLASPHGARQLGDFQVGDLIARGGMGAVYRARQMSLDREVALKILSPGGAEDPELIERFRIEAAAAASLVHPNIVSVYGFGEQEGEFYLAMRCVGGGSLVADAQGQVRPPMAPRAAAQMMVKVARAVHHAHERGILHRDLKPGNILLDESGEPILADFGLAKLIEGDVAITISSSTMGTPAYMAPEQARGATREITTAADVYGLGAVLYHLLTGRPPAKGNSPLETLRAVLEQEPPRPSLLEPAIDRDLETICLKCLEKLPARRYASAAAVADDLDCWLEHRPIQARRASAADRLSKWVRRHRARAAILLVAVIGLLTTTVVSLWMNFRLTVAKRQIVAQGEERRRDLAALQAETGNRVAENGDPLAALSYFAEAVRLETDHPDQVRINRQRFAFAMADAPPLLHEFPHPAAVSSVGFDPSGRRLITACADGAVRLWDLKRETLLSIPIQEKAPLHWAGFSPDGRWILVNAEGGEVTLFDEKNGQIAAGPWPGLPLSGLREDRGRHPTFSEDSRWCAIPEVKDFVLCDLSATPPSVQVVPETSSVNEIFFSPKNDQLVVALERAGTEMRALPSMRIITKIPGEGWRNGAWSPSGEQIALMSSQFIGKILDLPAEDGTANRLELRHLDTVKGCRFSPDGKRLLTWSYDGFARLFDTSTSTLRASPVSHDGPLTAAVFSPNGRTIATSGTDGFVHLLMVEPFQSMGARLPLASPVLDVAYSPRGDQLAAAGANGRVRVWAAPDGDLSFRHWVFASPSNSAVFSPSGSKLATVELRNTVEIWDVASGQAVCAPLQHPSRAGEIAWLDETHLVTTCGDFQVRTWKIPEGTVEASRPGPRTILGRLTGNLFLVRGKQGHELFDVSTGTHQLTLTDTEHSNLRLTPNQRFYAETQGNTVTVSTVAAPPKILFRRELDRDVSFAVVDDAAQHLAVAYMDFSIEIIGINGRDRVAGPFRHRSVVREMMFSPDGCILASGSDDGTLRLWDVSSGEPLSPPLRHGSRVIRIHFRPDGRAVATACSDGVARVWQIPSAPEDVQELKRLARRLNALGE